MNIVDKGEMALIHERAGKYFKKEGVIKRSYHFFRVGFEESYYMDFDAIVNDPNQCEDVTLLYRDKIRDIARQQHIDFLAPIEKSSGGTIGIIRLAGAISILTGIPNVPIRLTKEIKSEKVKIPPIEGKPIKGRLHGANVIILTDHCTTGAEVLDAVDAVEYSGGIVTDVISYSYRPDKFKWKRFKEGEIAFHFFYMLPDELKEGGTLKNI